MAVILKVERKTARARIFLALIYAILSLGGITMVWPFLVMLAASLTGPYDYYRHSAVVYALWDRDDRFLRYVATLYPRFPSEVFPDAPTHWGSWIAVAHDRAGGKEFAQHHLAPLKQDGAREKWQRMAHDYAAFNATYDLHNSVCTINPRDVAEFVRRHYQDKLATRDPTHFALLTRAARYREALELLNSEWPVRYSSFYGIRMVAEQRAPLHHAGWDYPTDDPKMALYQELKGAYRVASTPFSRTVPYQSRTLWLAWLERPDVRARLGLPREGAFNALLYTQVAGRECLTLEHLPFPLPPDAAAPLQTEWQNFIKHSYPRRLLRVVPTPELTRNYRRYVAEVCKRVEVYESLTGRTLDGTTFDALKLPEYENSTLWRNFIPQVPLQNLRVLSAEESWQNFLREKYGDLTAVNSAYGWQLHDLTEARLPLREALAVTYEQRGWRDFLTGMVANYRTVGEYLFMRGRAFGNTVLLVVLSILATLTVNPLAAYALSRFGLRSTEKILLFLLATMAFPAAVTAIPGFLLIRDLGLLNTFAALVLPGVASGMSIFILKGFFDGLPRELYEAAAIDGAKEWQIFLRITLPMTTPILAVSALNAFVHAYNSWEWALLVCQRQSHWTLAVWMYQMSQQFADQPWAVMAGFVLVSIPTALVFIACQKIILRGIVLPSMK